MWPLPRLYAQGCEESVARLAVPGCGSGCETGDYSCPESVKTRYIQVGNRNRRSPPVLPSEPGCYFIPASGTARGTTTEKRETLLDGVDHTLGNSPMFRDLLDISVTYERQRCSPSRE